MNWWHWPTLSQHRVMTTSWVSWESIWADWLLRLRRHLVRLSNHTRPFTCLYYRMDSCVQHPTNNPSADRSYNPNLQDTLAHCCTSIGPTLALITKQNLMSLTQCRVNVGTPSATLDQHWNNTGAKYHVCWDDISCQAANIDLWSLLYHYDPPTRHESWLNVVQMYNTYKSSFCWADAGVLCPANRHSAGSIQQPIRNNRLFVGGIFPLDHSSAVVSGKWGLLPGSQLGECLLLMLHVMCITVISIVMCNHVTTPFFSGVSFIILAPLDFHEFEGGKFFGIVNKDMSVFLEMHEISDIFLKHPQTSFQYRFACCKIPQNEN